MRTRWLAVALCAVVAMVLMAATGCSAFTPERTRMRMNVVRTDMDRIIDDIDWLFGLHRPSQIYDETLPP